MGGYILLRKHNGIIRYACCTESDCGWIDYRSVVWKSADDRDYTPHIFSSHQKAYGLSKKYRRMHPEEVESYFYQIEEVEVGQIK